jgi:hypothetical protein
MVPARLGYLDEDSGRDYSEAEKAETKVTAFFVSLPAFTLHCCREALVYIEYLITTGILNILESDHETH